MSDLPKKVLFVGSEKIKEFMADFSVELSYSDLASLIEVEYLIFYATPLQASHLYLLFAKVKEIVLGGEVGKYIVRASVARKTVFDGINAQDADKKRFKDINRDYGSNLSDLHTVVRFALVTPDMLLFETGEEVVSINSLFADNLGLETATKLLARTYRVEESQVSISISNR